MTWHYQIIEHTRENTGKVYSLIEVYLNEKNQVFTRELVDNSTEIFESPEDIIEELGYKLADAKKYPPVILTDLDNEIKAVLPEDNPLIEVDNEEYTPWD